MGASTVIAQLLMFIAVLGMATVAIVALTDYTGRTTSAINTNQKGMIEKIKTDIEIINVNPLENNTQVYVKNIGDTEMKTECINFFLDYDMENDSMTLNPSTRIEETLWSPLETLLINSTHGVLDPNVTHQVKVVTCNGISDTYTFSI